MRYNTLPLLLHNSHKDRIHPKGPSSWKIAVPVIVAVLLVVSIVVAAVLLVRKRKSRTSYKSINAKRQLEEKDIFSASMSESADPNVQHPLAAAHGPDYQHPYGWTHADLDTYPGPAGPNNADSYYTKYSDHH